MRKWFEIDKVDEKTYIISEYHHWEETHCYLLNGETYSLLIDSGLGISNISKVIKKLTQNPVIAISTHIHWDHIGGHKYYSDFYAHEAELDWLNGGFPQSIETIKKNVVGRCILPKTFDLSTYQFFQGVPTKVLYGGESIDIGGRCIEVIHTPGHSPGHMCFYEKETGYLFTGDLVYKGTLAAWFPTTNPYAYLKSLEMIANLPVKFVFPAHHSLDIQPEILIRMRDALRQLKTEDKLYHGSGLYKYEDWSIRL